MKKTTTVTVNAFVFMEKDYATNPDGTTDYCSPQVWKPAVWKCRVDDDHQRVFVGEQAVSVEVPDDFDPRPQQIKALEELKEKARADFSALVTSIDRQINELLALEA